MLVAAATLFVGALWASESGATSQTPSPVAHVAGNHLVDAHGKTLILRGVNRPGADYACRHGQQVFVGPTDEASIKIMKSWKVNSVRIPLNEDCWLGINGIPKATGGLNYQAAIKAYVALLARQGLVSILDLQWSGPGSQAATNGRSMADLDHSVAFWSSVANVFRQSDHVLFDLFNEPHDISWSCWKNGCTTPQGWKTAGMQQLVSAVRQAGASQPIMLGGLDWANRLDRWLNFMPSDPRHQLVASFHVYSKNPCNNISCWNRQVAPVAKRVPVVTGEIGEYDCTSNFIDRYMPWADARGISYLAWAWIEGKGYTCNSGPTLIVNYLGTPTPYGQGYRDHLVLVVKNR